MHMMAARESPSFSSDEVRIHTHLIPTATLSTLIIGSASSLLLVLVQEEGLLPEEDYEVSFHVLAAFFFERSQPPLQRSSCIPAMTFTKYAVCHCPTSCRCLALTWMP